MSSSPSNIRDASPQNPSPDLTNSGNPDNANPATAAPSATLIINGNNPATWQQDAPWHDNLGALFTHDGGSETIYSTSTVDTTEADATTIDYWAVVRATQQWLHASRTIIVSAAANVSDASTPDATSSLPLLDSAPPLVRTYSARPTTTPARPSPVRIGPQLDAATSKEG